MGQKKTHYSAKFKLQVILEVISWTKTQAQITSEYGIHPTQQASWKKQFLKWAEEIFQDKRKKDIKEESNDKLIEDLYKKIGQVTYERDWLEKKIEGLPTIFWKT
jgi:transposase-like protein